MKIAHYEDIYGTEFDCVVLGCSIDGEKYLIHDLDEGERGWCSCHLVDEPYEDDYEPITDNELN
jgi:hypothetical protein